MIPIFQNSNRTTLRLSTGWGEAPNLLPQLPLREPFFEKGLYPFLGIFGGAKPRKGFVHVFEGLVVIQIRGGIKGLFTDLHRYGTLAG